MHLFSIFVKFFLVHCFFHISEIFLFILYNFMCRFLAIIHLASMLKSLTLLIIFSLIFFPVNLPLIIKILLTAVAVAIVESLNNKMRLFKVRFYMTGAGVLLLLAIVAQ